MPKNNNTHTKLQQAQSSYNEIMKTLAPFLPKTENTQPPKPEIWIDAGATTYSNPY